MVTPFNPDGFVDFGGIERLTNHLVSGGVDYLVVMELREKVLPLPNLE